MAEEVFRLLLMTQKKTVEDDTFFGSDYIFKKNQVDSDCFYEKGCNYLENTKTLLTMTLFLARITSLKK